MEVLVFYDPLTLFMSFRARSVNISTLFLGNLPVLSAHSFASNWQLPFLNQRERDRMARNYFMTNLHEKMLLDVKIEPATFCMPGRHASDRATTPGYGIRFSFITPIQLSFTFMKRWYINTDLWKDLQQRPDSCLSQTPDSCQKIPNLF